MSEYERKGCGSHSCVIQKPIGVGTNGPCTCRDWKLKAEISRLQAENEFFCKSNEILEVENDKMREALEEVQADNERLKEALNGALEDFATLEAGYDRVTYDKFTTEHLQEFAKNAGQSASKALNNES